MSVGATNSDALALIEDAMREWLTVAIEDQFDIPLPREMRQIDAAEGIVKNHNRFTGIRK